MPNYGQSYFETLSPAPGETRLRHNTCRILDFSLVVLTPGGSHTFETGAREVAIVMLTGRADISVNGESFPGVGGRRRVFDAPPSMVYAPAASAVVIVADGACEAALCSAPSVSAIAPYRLDPADCITGTWGIYNTTRTYNYLVNADRPSERLHIAEVTVESGNWATYPPHKHDETRPVADEVFQEEMYFYRVDQPGGFGFCASYGGKADDDYAFLVRDNTIHKMPDGYHTVCAAPGYRVWYLALIAGEDKRHAVFTDPDHAWYFKAETALSNVRRNLASGGPR